MNELRSLPEVLPLYKDTVKTLKTARITTTINKQTDKQSRSKAEFSCRRVNRRTGLYVKHKVVSRYNVSTKNSHVIVP